MKQIIILFLFFALNSTLVKAQGPYETRLLDTYCFDYNLPTLNSSFIAYKKPCDGYVFIVENQTTLDKDSLVTFGSVAGRVANLSSFPGATIQYGTEYKVGVRTWIGTSSNSSGIYFEECFINTPSLESQVQTSQCGTTLGDINSPVYADNLSGAEAYTFELTNQTTLAVEEFEKTSGTLRAFTMANFPAAFITYGTTYEVRVKVKVDGTYGSYGTMCTITTPSIPTPQIQTSQCNITLTDIETIIYADNVTGAEAYTFELTNQTTLDVEEFEKSIGTIRAFTLEDFSSSIVDYNTTYDVRVKVQVDGTSGAYGSICTITTPPIPSTQLENYCNESIPFINSYLFAESITAAEAYRFEVTDGTNTTVISPNAPNDYIALIPVAWASYSGSPASISWVDYNTTVDIRVSAFIDGSWSSYGSICSISTPCGSKLENDASVNYLYYDPILAEVSSCSSIEDYQFRYRIGSSSTNYTTASIGNEGSEDPSDVTFFVSDFGPQSNFPSSNPYGHDFRVSTRIKSSGSWGPWGVEKIVTTPSNPTVKIRDGAFPAAGASQCGSSFGSPYVMSSITTILYSYNLYGFASYTFEVTELDGAGSDVETKFLTRSASNFGSLSRAFCLTYLDATGPTTHDGYWASAYNTTFRVRVRTNLGDYGEACYIQTPASPPSISQNTSNNEAVSSKNKSNGLNQEEQSINDETSVLFYPNPYNDENLNVTYSHHFSELNSIKLFSASGKLLHTTVDRLDAFINHSVFKELNSGIYFILITNSEGQQINSKLFKRSK